MIKKQQTQEQYEKRMVKVIFDLTKVSKMRPKHAYMVKLMDTVAFQDFEVALSMTFEQFDKDQANDN